ncbi:MAG TPA: DUF2142 domain-containing protein [Chitinophagaceae bacterium]|nr:DUF2142 domain-containing protein [Chitinophagaceae bacterium]HNF70822.1 DUF2142 domain-containing protein [Chitinophagaceae bacterium]
MKWLKQWSYPQLFVILALGFGFRLVFLNPPWHTNDEDRHFYNAYHLAQGHLGPDVKDSLCGYVMPVSLYEEVRRFQVIPYGEKAKLVPEQIDDISEKPLEPERNKFFATPSTKLPPFAYLPSAIMIKAGSFLHDSPVWLNWWGRIGSLLAYILIVFYAFKILPLFRPLLFMIALSPMALYQSASVSYDGLSLAFLFLFFAFVLHYYHRENPIGWKEIFILFAVAFFQRFSKDGYFPLYFCAAFIPFSRFQNRVIYFSMIGLLLVASFLPAWLWSAYLSSQHLPAELPLQKDYAFDMGKNLAFHLSDPLRAVKLLVLNSLSQGRVWIQGAIGRFGFSYTSLPLWFTVIQLMMMGLVTMTEPREKSISPRFQGALIALSFINITAIILLFFLSITPIGGYYLHGMQGRYFTPILPFLFAGLFYIPGFPVQWKNLKWITAGYCAVMLFYTLDFIHQFYYSA